MDQHEFHVGDCVQVKDWDELVEEFGITEEGHIPAPGFFNKKMKYMCGRVCHIKTIDLVLRRVHTEERIEYEVHDHTRNYWVLNISMIKPYIDPEEDSDGVQVSDYEQILDSCWMRE